MATNANSIFSKDFVKTVGGFLTQATSTGLACTRPELAKFIRKQYGRKLDYTDLNMWLSASINMGLFNTDDARFITKRGVGGGIVMVGAAKASVSPKPRAVKPKVKAAPLPLHVQSASVSEPTALHS